MANKFKFTSLIVEKLAEKLADFIVCCASEIIIDFIFNINF
jgi:hypothetical protein